MFSEGSIRNSDNDGQYTTRVATLNDTEILVEIGKKTFSDTFAAMNTAENIKSYLEKTFNVDQVRKELNDPRSTFILLYDGEKVAGYAKLKEDNDLEHVGKLEIERIYAGKEYIGKKVGKTLMQSCLDIAHSKNYGIVWLGVWEHNPRAIAFYERWGFKNVGAHPFQLGDDLQTDLIMEKKINEQ